MNNPGSSNRMPLSGSVSVQALNRRWEKCCRRFFSMAADAPLALEDREMGLEVVRSFRGRAGTFRSDANLLKILSFLDNTEVHASDAAATEMALWLDWAGGKTASSYLDALPARVGVGRTASIAGMLELGGDAGRNDVADVAYYADLHRMFHVQGAMDRNYYAADCKRSNHSDMGEDEYLSLRIQNLEAMQAAAEANGFFAHPAMEEAYGRTALQNIKDDLKMEQTYVARKADRSMRSEAGNTRNAVAFRLNA